MIKLFVTDLDGTLLNKDHESDEIIEEGIAEVFKHGRYFAIATGRHYNQVPVKFKDTNGYYVCLNGAVVSDFKGNVILERHIETKVLIDFMEMFKEMNFEYISKTNIYTFVDRETYRNNMIEVLASRGLVNTTWIDKFMHEKLENMIYEATFEQVIEAGICKINARRGPNIRFDLIEKYIEGCEGLMNSPCDDEMIEITASNVTKASALEWLANYLHIIEDEVAVYGDGGNDIQMLEAFTNSYAPSGSSKMALASAKNIIGAFEEYSVIKHIQSLL